MTRTARRCAALAAAAVALVAAGLAFDGGAAASSAAVPPCPTHALVGSDANGAYVDPPGCGGKIYVGSISG